MLAPVMAPSQCRHWDQKSPSTDTGQIPPRSRTDDQFVTGSDWFGDGDAKNWVSPR